MNKLCSVEIRTTTYFNEVALVIADKNSDEIIWLPLREINSIKIDNSLGIIHIRANEWQYSYPLLSTQISLPFYGSNETGKCDPNSTFSLMFARFKKERKSGAFTQEQGEF